VTGACEGALELTPNPPLLLLEGAELKKPPESSSLGVRVGAAVAGVADEPDEPLLAARAVTPVVCPATSAVSTPNAMTEPAISAVLNRWMTSSDRAFGMRAGFAARCGADPTRLVGSELYGSYGPDGGCCMAYS